MADNIVMTCQSEGTGGGHFCGNAFLGLQVKAADGTPSVPYGWALTLGGPSGVKSNYTWTPYTSTSFGQVLYIDNKYCNCGTLGTYRVNVYY